MQNCHITHLHAENFKECINAILASNSIQFSDFMKGEGYDGCWLPTETVIHLILTATSIGYYPQFLIILFPPLFRK